MGTKSLNMSKAENRAIVISKQHPKYLVFVMNKSDSAVVCTNKWVFRERIIEGWKTVKCFQNGFEIDLSEVSKLGY